MTCKTPGAPRVSWHGQVQTLPSSKHAFRQATSHFRGRLCNPRLLVACAAAPALRPHQPTQSLRASGSVMHTHKLFELFFLQGVTRGANS